MSRQSIRQSVQQMHPACAAHSLYARGVRTSLTASPTQPADFHASRPPGNHVCCLSAAAARQIAALTPWLVISVPVQTYQPAAVAALPIRSVVRGFSAGALAMAWFVACLVSLFSGTLHLSQPISLHCLCLRSYLPRLQLVL